LWEDARQVRGVGVRVLVALRALVVSLLQREGIRQKLREAIINRLDPFFLMICTQSSTVRSGYP
jgi:hypothetical protein